MNNIDGHIGYFLLEIPFDLIQSDENYLFKLFNMLE